MRSFFRKSVFVSLGLCLAGGIWAAKLEERYEEGDLVEKRQDIYREILKLGNRLDDLCAGVTKLGQSNIVSELSKLEGLYTDYASLFMKMVEAGSKEKPNELWSWAGKWTGPTAWVRSGVSTLVGDIRETIKKEKKFPEEFLEGTVGKAMKLVKEELKKAKCLK